MQSGVVLLEAPHYLLCPPGYRLLGHLPAGLGYSETFDTNARRPVVGRLTCFVSFTLMPPLREEASKSKLISCAHTARLGIVLLN